MRVIVKGVKEGQGWFADSPNPHVPGATAAGGTVGASVSLSKTEAEHAMADTNLASIKVLHDSSGAERIEVKTEDGRIGIRYLTETVGHPKGSTDGALSEEEWQNAKRLGRFTSEETGNRRWRSMTRPPGSEHATDKQTWAIAAIVQDRRMGSRGNSRTPGYDRWDKLTRDFSKYTIRKDLRKSEASSVIDRLNAASDFEKAADIIDSIKVNL
jgi:hypothetical protein